MYSLVWKQLLQLIFDRLGEGDSRLALAVMADNAVFRFPGRNPFAAENRSKQEMERWLRRFAHFRPKFQIHRVLVSGPPWDLWGCMVFTDWIGDPSDPGPYSNEGVCTFHICWGRVVEARVFLDTQAIADFFGTESAEQFFADAPLSD